MEAVEILNGAVPEVPQVETKWYVLRVVSGKERKVKEYLDKDLVRNGWTTIIKQIFLPMEKVYKVQNGKKSNA
jgi:transcriptional antiterminator NusG